MRILPWLLITVPALGLVGSACTPLATPPPPAPRLLAVNRTPTPTGDAEPNSNNTMARANLHGTGVYLRQGITNFHALKWKFDVKAFIRSGPVVANNLVYFTSNDLYLHAVDTQTGHEKWKFKTGLAVATTPAIADGGIYFGSGNTIYALDAATGQKIWQVENTGDPPVYSAAAVQGDVLYIGGSRALYALDRSTGQTHWLFRIPHYMVGSPVIDGNSIYVGTASPTDAADTYLYAIDTGTGAAKWEVHLPKGAQESPAVVDNVIYVGTGSRTMLALDSTTGKEKWRASYDGVVNGPAIVNGSVLSTAAKALHALDAKTGQPLWELPTNSFFQTAPVVADGFVYIGVDYPSSSELLVVDVVTGQLRWRMPVASPAGVPAIGDGVVYVQGENGILYAIQ